MMAQRDHGDNDVVLTIKRQVFNWIVDAVIINRKKIPQTLLDGEPEG